LILEDEPLIALDLQTMLEAEGFRNVEVIATCAEAEIWVMNRTPSVALIDVRLKDGSSSGVATMLRDRNVPLIVCSGTSKSEADAAFHSATWVSKPCAPAELTAAVYSAWDLHQD
jgi:DNA-binding response OmpR family regulator